VGYIKANKTQPFVAYKKHTSLAKINTSFKQKDGKRYSKQMKLANKQE
jgi:hypothetical protein